MERGVYFDAWFPRQHCYHPSLPPRRLRMVDHLEELRATVLVWSALGGGSLSLPYLEQEAFGTVEARSRFYGFVNDSEFIAACQTRGIKVFGIVFEAQGWEFPVELNDSEDEILALNETRGAGRPDWIGLREFSQNRYPKLWKPFEHYFPGGLTNSDGRPVTDLIEECCARDIHQRPLHAAWVECPDRDHQCFYMDRNNPVWREYLKAAIRIQIDAGVDGVQLDEAELPMGALQYGGCFCKDCMKQFRSYLAELDEAASPAELASLDLETFHYGDWLLAQGYDFTGDRGQTPLFGAYYRFQCAAIARHFGELASYARDYAASQGRQILVSGNFFNVDPQYLALADDVDLVITEMRNTTYRQPEWFRYVAAFAADKDVLVVENPYGGVVPDLVEQLGIGHGYDRFRASIFEGAAFGANMTVPYGSWMGATIEDAFYAPPELTAEVQTFLAEHDDCFTKRSWNKVAVVFSVESTRADISRADASDNLTNARDASVEVPYRVVTTTLAQAGVPFDVVIFPDGVTAADRVQVTHLTTYQTVILPAVTHLTDGQAAALESLLDKEVCVVATGELGTNLPAERRQSLAGHRAVQRAASYELDELVPLGPQVRLAADCGVHIHRLADDAAAVHILNYAYDAEADRVVERSDVRLEVELDHAYPEAMAHHSDGASHRLEVRHDHSRHAVTLPRLGLYTIVVFHDGRRRG